MNGMRDAAPVLELDGARPATQVGEPREPAYNLRVMPKDLVLVQAQDTRLAAQFADLCVGLSTLEEGRARFLGHDWAQLSDAVANFLRGRMGRMFGEDGWLGFLDMETNILLSQLHHSDRDHAGLRVDAADLAQFFGLPGLPLGRSTDYPPAALRRAACVRAFLGEPMLLILEDPVPDDDVDLLLPLLSALEAALDRGAAAIWLTSSRLVWDDANLPATERMHLRERGLVSARMDT